MLKKFKKLLFIIISLTFISCSNFFDGGTLLEQLDIELTYLNTPYVSATITKTNNDDLSEITSSEFLKKQKVGFPFEIFYTPNSSFIFVRWQAVDSLNQALAEDDVCFEDAESPVTKVTVNTKKQIKIQAVSMVNPKLSVSFIKNFMDSGSITSSDSYILGLDDEKPLVFVESPQYQFIKWESSNDSVVVKDPKSPVTSITAKKGGNALITAICIARPKVLTSNTMNLDASLPKDTSIVINFDHELAKENDIASGIKLLFSGNELCYGNEEPFGTPYFYINENGETQYDQIIIPSNKYHTLDVDFEKDMEVIIPETFYFNDKVTDSNIYLGSSGHPFKWTYKVNSNTNTNAVITASINTAYGSLEKGTNGAYRIGDTATYSFKLKNEYKFVKWNIVQVPADIATISENEEHELSISIKDTGTISLNVQAVEIPTFTYSPEFLNSGRLYNTPIEVQFNKVIKNGYFTTNYISIKNDKTQEDYSSYFTFSSSVDKEKTKLVIKPDYSIKEIFANSSEPIDIRISFSSAIEDVDGEKLSVGKDWVHRIINSAENNPPQIQTLQITRINNFSDSQIIPQRTFANWTSAGEKNDFVTHHVGNKIYIKVMALDSDSGVNNKLTVTEQRVLNVQGESVGNVESTVKQAILLYDEKQESMRSMIFLYNFETEYDGLINLSFEIEDNAGNKSTASEKYDLIKDTKIDFSNLLVYNTIEEYQYVPGMDTAEYRAAVFPNIDLTYKSKNESVKDIYIKYSDIWFVYNNVTFSTPAKNLEVVVKTSDTYKTKNELTSYKRRDFSKITDDTLLFNYYDLSAQNDNYIYIDITDALGNKKTTEYVIPKAAKITGHNVHDYSTGNKEYFLGIEQTREEQLSLSSEEYVYYVEGAHLIPLVGDSDYNIMHEAITHVNYTADTFKADDLSIEYYCAAQNRYFSKEYDTKYYTLYGFLGNEYKCTGEKQRNSSFTLPEFTFVNNEESNDTTRSITITWTDPTQFNSEYEYYFYMSEYDLFVEISDIKEYIPKEFQKDTFVLNMLNSMETYFILVGIDKNGFEYCSEHYSSETENDVTPPYAGSKRERNRRTGLLFTVEDTNELADPITPVEYWVLPYYEGIEKLNEQEVSKFPKHVVQISQKDNDQKWVCYSGIKDTEGLPYVTFAKFYDKAGNNYFGYLSNGSKSSFCVKKMVGNNGEDTKFHIYESERTAPAGTTSYVNSNLMNIQIENCDYPTVDLTCELFKGRDFIDANLKKNEGGTTNKKELDVSDPNCEIESDVYNMLLDSPDGHFLRYQLSTYENGSYYVTAPDFVYIGTSCTYHEVVKLSDKAIYINSNAPYIVFTLASAKNRGNDKAEWFLNGMDSNYIQLNNDNYYTIEKSEIEENDYYVICCIFADNTFYMSAPMQYHVDE